MTELPSETTTGRSGSTRPLLVADRKTATDMAWADMATSADEAMTLWRAHRHTHVLINFGALPCGSNGLRLTRRLRAEDSETLVFLLSDTVSPVQAACARFSGAFAVVPRERRSVAACLSGWTQHGRGAHLLDGSVPDETMLAARRLIVSSLLSMRRLSPGTLSSIEAALSMPEPVDSHAHCSVSALARAVAERMDRGSDRAALLTWLHRIDSVKAGASMAESGPMTPDRPLVSAMSATTVDFAFEPCASH